MIIYYLLLVLMTLSGVIAFLFLEKASGSEK